MKFTKKLSTFAAALVFCLGILLCASLETQAASSIPTKTRIYAGGVNSYALEFSLPKVGDTIKNLKSNSKYLLLKQTRTSVSKSSYSGDSNEVTIGMFAKKEGTYKVSFDIYRNGKKYTKKTITVYAKNDSPIKTCKFSCSRNAYGLTTAKTSTVKVTMNKGYTLKKIEVGTIKTTSKVPGTVSSEYVYKTIKNGGKFTLGTKPYTSSGESGSLSSDYYYKYSSTDMIATTVIRITYVDKYTKTQETVNYSLARYA
ncbi:MAG: hypothetical protein Q4F41_13380 [Eubacteriales bacterium]|nr:hypothetical protein [Eubacteriales bacterium]